MNENGHANGLKAPDATGGASSAIDPTNERDRASMRTAMTRWPRRWRGITADRKDKWADALDRALALAEQVAVESPAVAANTMASCLRTGVMMEAQNQADDHLEEKYLRLDGGQVTERVGFVKYVGGVSEEDL